MKRFLAMLICLCLVLGMVPAGISVTANAEANQALVLDDQNQGLCPVCNRTVTWTPIKNGERIGALSKDTEYHYYLAEDVSALSAQFGEMSTGTNVCLHLNGKNVITKGRIEMYSGATLNIFGEGSMTFNGDVTNDSYRVAAINLDGSSTVNLYGGTYAVSGRAAEENAPFIRMAASANVNILDQAAVNGTILTNKGTLVLDGAATAADIDVGTNGKLNVKKTWTGTAQVDFSNDLQNNVVPAANGTTDGAFIGTLNMRDGVVLQGSENGTLTATGFNKNLVLDENGQGYCEVCQDTVTWTAINNGGRIGAPAKNGEYHFYLAEDVTAQNAQFAELTDSTLCLHLNGHDVIQKGRIHLCGTTTMNILGSGKMTFNAEVTSANAQTQAGYRIAGINLAYGATTLNVYGGTFATDGQAVTENAPFINMQSATQKVNLYKTATINGELRATKGDVTLNDSANAANLTVGAIGKIKVAAGWKGTAVADFDCDIVDDAIPAANGSAAGAFTGSLKLTDGSKLQAGENGLLVIKGLNSDLVLDDNSQAECPVCNETVTWTAIKNGGRIGAISGDDHHHFYLQEDMTAQNAQFAELDNTTQVCLHLNGKKLVQKGRIQMWKTTVLNIFGKGEMTFTGDVTSNKEEYQTAWRMAAINMQGNATVNFLGGTFAVDGQAATDNVPFVTTEFKNAKINVMDSATVKGKIQANSGSVLLNKKAAATDIYIGTDGKLTVDGTWSGLATVAFAAAIEKRLVPEANGVATGEYSGSLFLADGRALLYENGRLRAKDLNAELEVDEAGQALCPVCNETVTWVDVADLDTKHIGLLNDGAHHHYYISENTECAEDAQFLELANSTSVCLHLNGKNLTYSGRMLVGAGSTLNVTGTGLVTYEGDCTNADYNSVAIEAADATSTINLLSGTYVNAGAALDNGKPIVNLDAGTGVLKDAAIKGKVNCTSGTVTLIGKANVDNLHIGSTAKLIVEAGWEGFANAKFAAQLSNGALPEANGASTGSFPGGLLLDSGEILKGENGRLVVNDNKKLLLTEDNRGYCQACKALVTWTPIKAGGRVGVQNGDGATHLHYYFAQDNITCQKAQFMEVYDLTVCIHLNGMTVDVPGRIYLSGSTINLMGDGEMEFTADTGNEKYQDCFIRMLSRKCAANIYGGTYVTHTDKPMVKMFEDYQPETPVNLLGDVTIEGKVILDFAKLKLTAGASVSDIEVYPSGRIIVDKDWTGTATAKFRNTVSGPEVAAANGECNGEFIGGLKLTDGRLLKGRNGRLVLADEKELRLNDKSQGYCTACDAVVTWTAVQGQSAIGTFDKAEHQHYYLSGNLNADATQVLSITDTDFCLHLNGHNVTGSEINVGENASLNVMGNGNITCAIPTNGNVLVKDVAIKGLVDVQSKTVTLDGEAKAEKISVAASGKLTLADTWTGAATVSFAAPFIGNTVPSLTGESYTGTLTLTDSRTVTGNTIGGTAVNEKLSYRTTEDSAELVAYTGEGNFLLPEKIAGKPVTAIADGAFDNFNGKLFIGKNNTVGLAYAQEKNLAYTEVDSFTQDNGVIQLQADADSLTFDKDTYLDLNGYDVANVTVTAGTLYVMDSQTDDYTVADGVYGNIANSTGAVQAADGYLKVTQATGVSFHCLTLNIDAMTLRPEVAGVYYNSTIAGDEIVAAQVQTYGVALSLNEDMANSGYSVYHNFAAGADTNAKGTLLKNVMKTGLSDAKNGQRAQMPVYGRAYIKTSEGYIFGETVCRDTKTQIELANEGWEELNKTQKDSARAMYETYQPVVADWDVSNMENYVDRLWYTTPAPDTAMDWEEKSLPIGNGYSGTSVFGGTESETLSFSEETLFNPSSSTVNCPMEGPDGEAYMRANGGGFANLCKAHLDFGHPFTEVTNYERDLVLDTAEAHVSYDYDGVTYNRTYFASYPDNVTVMKLDASQSGKLTFTLRPVATYIRDYCVLEGDGRGKTGTVTASGDTAVVAGTLTAFNVNYEAQFKVIPTGGTMVANDDGTITVTGADSAVILVALGTNYVLAEETFTNPAKEKLDPNSFPHDKLTARINAAATKSYEELRSTHRADHQEFYNRVEVDLGGEPSTTIPTDQQIAAYRVGEENIHLEELMFQYGRYLLIASSREGSLPANLQGVWNYYCSAAWAGVYVYNINLPMTYWPSFNTNLIELFQPNVDLFDTFYSKLQTNADDYLEDYSSPNAAPAGTGENGLCWDTAVSPYAVPSAPKVSHSGPGAMALTTQLYWDYYDFSRDDDIFEAIYPYVEGTAKFLSKTLKEYDGKWLVANSASPENCTNWSDSWYITVGTAFDQQLTLQNYLNLLEAVRIKGNDIADQALMATIDYQIDKLDPVIVGKSGQVKEYREEEYYGDMGEYYHRHLSQLMGLFPGNTITAKTPAWLDAARYSLQERGLGTTGWSIGNRINAWARTKDGNGTHYEIQYMLKQRTNDNLWGTHPPFQIECNFGYTAGLAEMLVQGHEGFIEVLPALPDAWPTGSFKGLTARGGFEVDAAWENGSATKVSITSNAGEELVFKYFGAANATVVDSKGNSVSFTSEGSDMIRFATTEGETYTITNLGEKFVVEKPAELAVTDNFQLSWVASPDAVSYKVYRAVNSQATYDLIAENVTGTTYSYNPTDLKAGDQVTIRITAVNADGVESDGIRVITWFEE